MTNGQPDATILIKTNKAALVESAVDIENFLSWQPEKTKVPVQKTLFSELSESEQRIYELIMKEGELSIDHICRNLEIPISKLSPQLLQMEFKGLIKCYPGNVYKIDEMRLTP